jgi:hypothetical protein
MGVRFDTARGFVDDYGTEIRSYRNLDYNWDTYGGVCATERSVQFAIDLLTKLTTIPLPRVAPISAGVYLEWERGITIEVDDESVLLSDDTEDPTFDVDKAADFVLAAHAEELLPC